MQFKMKQNKTKQNTTQPKDKHKPREPKRKRME